METGLSTLHYPPQTLPQFLHDVHVAWNEVSQSDIDYLIFSMPRHVQEFNGYGVAKYIILFFSQMLSFHSWCKTTNHLSEVEEIIHF